MGGLWNEHVLAWSSRWQFAYNTLADTSLSKVENRDNGSWGTLGSKIRAFSSDSHDPLHVSVISIHNQRYQY